MAWLAATHPNAMDFSNTRSSSLTNVRFKDTGVRSPMVTGHEDFVQNGLGLGSKGFSPRYTSRRCRHGMSFGPPTRHVYFSFSNSRSSNVPLVASVSAALGRRRADVRDETPGEAVARDWDLRRLGIGAPFASGRDARAWRRASRAFRAGAKTANAARASGAVDIVPTQLRTNVPTRLLIFCLRLVSGEWTLDDWRLDTGHWRVVLLEL